MNSKIAIVVVGGLAVLVVIYIALQYFQAYKTAGGNKTGTNLAFAGYPNLGAAASIAALF